MNLNSSRLFFTILVTTLVSSGSAFGKTLSELALYRRCYANLIGESPKFNDSNLLLIKAGSRTGAAACQDLLSRMSIDPNSADGKLVDPNDAVAVKGLNHFYNVTRQFTKINRLQGNLANLFEDYAGTEDIYDTTSTALVMTENALNSSRNYRDIFTITKAPAAKRTLNPDYATLFMMKTIYGATAPNPTDVITGARSRHGLTFYSGTANTDPANAVNANAVPYAIGPLSSTYYTQPFVKAEVGELQGIHYNSPAQPVTVGATTTLQNLSAVMDVSKPIFNGIFGLRSYVLANTNFIQGNSTRPNLLYMPRRLSQAIIRDFLCRDLPVVRESDIASYVSTDAAANPFRKASSCVSCHATIDPMASTWRGLGAFQIGNRDPNTLQNFSMHPSISLPVNGFAQESGWPAIQDNDFHKRPAKGRLMFRTYSGALIKQPDLSVDVNGMVAAIAATDDVYICTAKKYFKHFTGIDVPMFDAGDSKNATYMQSLSSTDWKYRNFVINAGLHLKDHQKVKNLIQEIMQSPFYNQSDFGKGN